MTFTLALTAFATVGGIEIFCKSGPEAQRLRCCHTHRRRRAGIVEHIEPEGFRLPITILVLDHAGEVACITIDAERTSFH
jgi:hypothetical protein